MYIALILKGIKYITNQTQKYEISHKYTQITNYILNIANNDMINYLIFSKQQPRCLYLAILLQLEIHH